MSACVIAIIKNKSTNQWKTSEKTISNMYAWQTNDNTDIWN